MSKDCALARKRQFQRIVEDLRDLVAQFEEYRSDVESLTDLFIQTADADAHFLNITGLNKKQILRRVAEKRIRQYSSRREASESLGIDVRTLETYLAYPDADD